MSRYRIRYTFETAPFSVMTRDVGALNPIAALNQFHAQLQLEENVEADAYAIKDISMIYAANAMNRTGDEMVESSFDLPKCSNPILKKKAEKPVAEPTPWF